MPDDEDLRKRYQDLLLRFTEENRTLNQYLPPPELKGPELVEWYKDPDH